MSGALRICFSAGLLLLAGSRAGAAPGSSLLFQQGTQAFRSGNYGPAAEAFRQAAILRPASGTLQNLGLAEWQRGRHGPAVLAWEQALWLDPFNSAARQNLQFARKAIQVESPQTSWYEVVSGWLPVNGWAWITGLSLWVSVGMIMLPGVFRLRRVAWHQGVAACGLAVFLLSIPAHLGVNTRSRLGFVLEKDTPLRLTPTREAQFITRLGVAEPARLERVQGDYVLVRTSRAAGWLSRTEFGLVCPPR